MDSAQQPLEVRHALALFVKGLEESRCIHDVLDRVQSVVRAEDKLASRPHRYTAANWTSSPRVDVFGLPEWLADPDLEQSFAERRAAPAKQLEERALVGSVGVLEDLNMRQGLTVQDERLAIANGVKDVWRTSTFSHAQSLSPRCTLTEVVDGKEVLVQIELWGRHGQPEEAERLVIDSHPPLADSRACLPARTSSLRCRTNL